MKQDITKPQLDELSEKGIRLYDNWLLDHGYVNDLITIGQMIEFLDEYREIRIKKNHESKLWEVEYLKNDIDDIEFFTKKIELCDALWEAVKEVLEK